MTEQAGAELCQAQGKLELIFFIFEVVFIFEVAFILEVNMAL